MIEKYAENEGGQSGTRGRASWLVKVSKVETYYVIARRPQADAAIFNQSIELQIYADFHRYFQELY